MPVSYIGLSSATLIRNSNFKTFYIRRGRAAARTKSRSNSRPEAQVSQVSIQEQQEIRTPVSQYKSVRKDPSSLHTKVQDLIGSLHTIVNDTLGRSLSLPPTFLARNGCTRRHCVAQDTFHLDQTFVALSLSERGGWGCILSRHGRYAEALCVQQLIQEIMQPLEE